MQLAVRAAQRAHLHAPPAGHALDPGRHLQGPGRHPLSDSAVLDCIEYPEYSKRLRFLQLCCLPSLLVLRSPTLSLILL